MNTNMNLLRPSLIAVLIGFFILPGATLLLPLTDADARGVAVRTPRGGAVAVGGVGYRRAPVARSTARRTTRRVARRTTRRLYTMPYGYTRRMVGGVNYYYHGSRYYESYYQGSTVVYVEVVFD